MSHVHVYVRARSVGRTARAGRQGQAVITLQPNEREFCEILEGMQVPLVPYSVLISALFTVFRSLRFRFLGLSPPTCVVCSVLERSR